MLKDFIQLLIKESEAYQSMDMIEGHIEGGGSLANIPVQPLFMAMKNLTPEETSLYLPKLSKEQREVFLDLDLWKKDALDVDNFHFWIKSYGVCDDEKVRTEMAMGAQFSLYLKGKFNIWTFDVEDPQYPDHDNYFLTEDNLLLFEFESDFEFVSEVKQIIKDLYTELGVENAYVHLFKLVSDSNLLIEEEEYRFKKARLSDYGFVDYFEALETVHIFANQSMLDNFLVKKSANTGEVDNESLNQCLHKQALLPYQSEFDSINNFLEKVEDEKRMRFIQFNFIRLVNSSITLEDALKSGSIAMNRVGEKTRSYIQLGFHYINDKLKLDSPFDTFDFTDCYRVGKSLLTYLQKDVVKKMKAEQLGNAISFVGKYWEEFLTELSNEPPKLARPASNAVAIIDFDDYQAANRLARSFGESVPFIKSFHKMVSELISDNLIQDDYYENFDVNEIDFEIVLINSFANEFLAEESKDLKGRKKLGLTLPEFKTFIQNFVDDEDEFTISKAMNEKIDGFLEKYGLAKVYNVGQYFRYILQSHLEGYEYSSLSTQDYKHVGGVILLRLQN